MVVQKQQDVGDELCALARSIRAWQLLKDITDTDLCAGDYDIGSTKTFRNFAEDNTEGYDVNRWLPRYRAAWNLIQAKDTAPEEQMLFEDLTPAVRLRAAFSDAMRETGNDRLIIIEGNPGEGKSASVACLMQRYGSRIVLCEAAETWRESINAQLSDMLSAIGCTSMPPSAAGKLDKLIAILCEHRRCLVIDEAHHMGPRGLNTVKTIINRTPGEVIMMGLPVLMKRLERDAYQEARQLTLNRLCERICLHGVEPDDAARIIERSGGISAEVSREVGTPLASMALNRGALKFVSRVARRVARDGAYEADAILKLASKVAASR